MFIWSTSTELTHQPVGKAVISQVAPAFSLIITPSGSVPREPAVEGTPQPARRMLEFDIEPVIVWIELQGMLSVSGHQCGPPNAAAEWKVVVFHTPPFTEAR